ncbi:NADH:flavin oxidoreductase/NADH oxidase family protein [Ruegeria arenilitoris]|uniref:NADH:flavin oxidoreductase/NADH oxidase family protein n=1 Tax=Ruegeria arenilitoris TaxID=1173585 RepID=UPI001C938816|nr:NADH:flavin oxidoreductase/NADH oxidase family protein [Ruegeria arenilitoris]MBY6084056.1 NADH:flavin oxidoreductase/NADH oxidase family protein [Ruegeria arenilitoris]
MTVSPLFEPLTLPNGAVLKNRLAKAAMEESLATFGQVPDEKIHRLFRRWAAGGAGLLITGNVMVSADALSGPASVVLEDGTDLAPFREWAEAGQTRGGAIWMQINHPGRQVLASLGEETVSASDVPVEIPGMSKNFNPPRALTEAEIQDLVARFARTAALAEEAGFDGVQIHAAHGYLISQFLSPLTNRRTDHWGGSLENRARFLFEVVRAIRASVSRSFTVSVKLNSADFQKGGFGQDDAKWVVNQLGGMAIDLVELSGGSYESPAMQGRQEDGSSTARREAYFVDFAREIAADAKMPIMVTGGIRSRAVAEDALANNRGGIGVSVLGVARAMAFEPDLVENWRNGKSESVNIPEVSWKNKRLAGFASMVLAYFQLERLANGKPPKVPHSAFLALMRNQMRAKRWTKRYRSWRDARA